MPGAPLLNVGRHPHLSLLFPRPQGGARGGGGGGGTDSLSMGTNCKTTAALFGQRTVPVLLPPNLQPPLFMETQAQLIETNTE